ncbi:MAG TPA: MmcQ/YjbR family DNA-binding protein [Anaerolineales bacterium]|nr:MmcQ/YjbR family DNA-binding protein [Anaerolineales bacterium]
MSKKQLERVRRICFTLPETTERLSHGEPTFFVKDKVYVMFANNHHNDGHIAVWLPVPSGLQATLIETAPETFFKPPYVGVRGWVGIELNQITDPDLTYHIQVAWELVAPKRLSAQVRANNDPSKSS